MYTMSTILEVQVQATAKPSTSTGLTRSPALSSRLKTPATGRAGRQKRNASGQSSTLKWHKRRSLGRDKLLLEKA